jgi:hypothetical protein
MNMAPKQPFGAYRVGYGKPPIHSRFRPGVSGNPHGRPRGVSTDRAISLTLKEAYRQIAVREGDETRTLPALQAAIRKLMHIGLKGNGPALRAYITMVREIEQAEAKRALAKAADEASLAGDYLTDEDRVRALEAFLKRTSHLRD